MGGGGEVDDNNWPSNYFKFSGAAPEVLSCPTFVPKRGDLGKTKAGWRHKVFATHAFLYFFGPHIFPFVFPRIILFRWAVLNGGVPSHPIHSPPGSASAAFSSFSA